MGERTTKMRGMTSKGKRRERRGIEGAEKRRGRDGRSEKGIGRTREGEGARSEARERKKRELAVGRKEIMEASRKVGGKAGKSAGEL